jgi:transcriptional regulator with XRE-family HTH domain
MNIEFKVALLRRGLTQRQVARKLGISDRYMSDIILGNRKAPRIRARLVKELGLPARAVGAGDPSGAAA